MTPQVIINIRGTSGSGKSHLARRVLHLYPSRLANYVAGRNWPLSYVCTAPERRALFVLGNYEAEWGGGADTVSRELGFKELAEAAKIGCNLFWEGVIFSDEVPKTIELSRIAETHIIQLNTPVEQCLADIRARRERAGNVKELSTKNTVERISAIDRACGRLKLSQAPGIDKKHVVALDREAAFSLVVRLLGLDCNS